MMHTWALLSPAIIIGGILLACVIPALLIILVLRLFGGGDRSGRRGGLKPEDLQIVQEIHTSLGAMERRIEALETILLERIKER